MNEEQQFELENQDAIVGNANADAAKSIDPEGFEAWRDANTEIEENEADLRSFYDAVAKAEEQATRDAIQNPQAAMPPPTSEGEDGGEEPQDNLWKPPAEGVAAAKTEDLLFQPGWLDAARTWYKYENGEDFKGSDADLSAEAIDHMSSYKWNLVSTGNTIATLYGIDDPVKRKEFAEALVVLQRMYDWSDGGAEEFGRAVKWLTLDPSTWAGLGVGGAAAKGAARLAAKKSLDRAIQFAITGGTAGAAEGGLVSGAVSVADQTAEVKAGVKEEVSATQTAADTAIGAAGGAVLGFGGGYLTGHIASRYITKLQRKMKARADATRSRISDMTPEEHAKLDAENQPELTAEQEARLEREAIQAESGVKPGKRPDPSPKPDESEVTRLSAGGKVRKSALETGDNPRTGDKIVDEARDNLSKNVKLLHEAEQRLAAAEARGIDPEILGRMREGIDKRSENVFMSEMAFAKQFTARYGSDAKDEEWLRRRMYDQEGDPTAEWDRERERRREERWAAMETLTPEEHAIIEMYDKQGEVLRDKAEFERRVEQKRSQIEAGLEDADYKKKKRDEQREAMADAMRKTHEARYGKQTPEQLAATAEANLERSAIQAESRAGGKAAKKGYVRYYHGGNPEGVDGPLWFTSSIEDAEGWANRAGDSNDPIWYVDVPENDPVRGGDPANGIIHPSRVEMPPEIANKRQLLHRPVPDQRPKLGDLVVDPETNQVGKYSGMSPNGAWKIKMEDGSVRAYKPGAEGTPTMEVTGKSIVEETDRLGHTSLSFKTYSDPETSRILDIISRREGRIGAKRKGAQTTDKAMVEKAIEQSKIRDITDLKIDTKNLTPEDIIELGVSIEKQAQELSRVAERLNARLDAGGLLSPDELTQFAIMEARLNSALELLSGAGSEAGRMLRAFKVINEATRKRDEFAAARAIGDIIKAGGGSVNLERKIGIIAEASKNSRMYVPHGQRGAINVKAIVDAASASWAEKLGVRLVQMRYNMMLSSVRTHVTNLWGHVSVGLYENFFVNPTKVAISEMNHYLRAMLGVPLNPEERYRFQTWKTGLQGYRNSLKESIVLARQVLAGEVDMGEGKIANELGLRYGPLSTGKTKLGKMGTVPVRMLEATDALFKNMHYNARLYELAEKKAWAESQARGGRSYEKVFEHWVKNPDNEMKANAKAWSQKITFTNDPSIYGGLIGGTAAMLARGQQSHPVMQMIMPFVRTPMNLIGYAADQTPLGVMIKPMESYRLLMNGTHDQRIDVAARMTIAAGIMAIVTEYYDDGIITGEGHPNRQVRNAREATGWRSNAIKVGEKYYQLTRLDPGALVWNIAATSLDLIHAAKTSDDKIGVVGATLLALADLFKDRGTLAEYAEFLEMISSRDLGRAGSKASDILASYITPSLGRDFRNFQDPYRRDLSSNSVAEGVWKSVQNALPYLSENIPADVDWKGDYIKDDGTPMWRAIVPIPIKLDVSSQDRASAAVAYAQLPVDKLSETLSLPGMLPGTSIDLLAMDDGKGWVFQQFKQFVGKARHQMVSDVVNDPSYQDLLDSKDAFGRDDAGPNSIGASLLSDAMSRGYSVGVAQFMEWLSTTDKFEAPNGEIVEITHPFDPDQYTDLVNATYVDKDLAPGELKKIAPQYQFKDRPIGDLPRFGL